MSLRVLTLEDSDLDAELILRELKRCGIEFTSRRVETREDFERALGEFQPGIILADYRLPAFNGAQALAIAVERCPEVPMIIVSGAVGEETAVELLKNGATDFVLKDRLSRLVPAIHRALREVRERTARLEAEASLRALNEQLEQRVAERTHELCEKNALMEADLKMAHDLQIALLPTSYPTLPRGAAQAASAVKFISIYQPTASVSGDFFNFVRVTDTAVAVLICDVMGHGVRAALVTAMMRALEEQLGELVGDPGALLTEINRALRGILRQSGTTLFTTACYVIADIATSQITFANAGHPSPLHLHGVTREVDAITSKQSAGPALGLFDDVKYETHARPVAAGDLILFFTDGLFDVENGKSESFSQSRLRDAIRQRAGLPSAQLVHDVYAEIEKFADGQAFADDVCFIGMEIARVDSSAV